MARFYFSIQTRLYRNAEGAYYTIAGYARYEKWLEYLEAFDEVHLICRVTDSDENLGHRVDGPGVIVHDLPTYRSWGSLLGHLPGIVSKLWKLPVTKDDSFGGRLFDVLSLLLFIRARASRPIPFLAEIVGDPVASARLGALGLPGKLTAPLIGLVTRRITKSADATIYVTEHTLQKLYPPRKNRPTVSFSSVEVPSLPGRFTSRDYLINPIVGPLKLLAVGSHEQRYKGHDLLIKATKLLNETGISTRTTIVGGGRYHAELRNLVHTLDLDTVVTFTGSLIDRAEIDRYYQAADLFVLPSRTEGLCRALIEAMSWGNACIASAVGGNQELLPENALFEVESVDAIVDRIRGLIANQEILSELSQHGIQSSKRFAPEARKVNEDERKALLKGLGRKRT